MFEQVDDGLNKLANLKSRLSSINSDILSSLRLLESFNETERFFKSIRRKPIIGFFGNHKSGKSFLINTITDKEILLSEKIVNLIVLTGNIEDRPSFISSVVAFFGKNFNPNMINDEDHVKKNLVWQGDFDVTNSLDSKKISATHFVVIFTRTDITRHVWLMEAPATSEGALRSVEFADGAILLSPHSHFLQQEDLSLFENILRRCPPFNPQRPLDHILLVQSHCPKYETEKTKEVSRQIVETNSNQLNKLAFEFLQEHEYIESIPEKKELAEKIQPFLREDSYLRKETLSKITDLARYLLESKKEQAQNYIECGFMRLNRVLDTNIQIAGALLSSEKTRERRISEMKSCVDRFRKESEHIITQFEEFIKYCAEKKSFELKFMDNCYETMTSETYLATFIEYSFRDEEQARREIGNYVGHLIASKIERTLKKSGETISKDIENLILQWQKALPSALKLQFSATGDKDCYEILSFDPEIAFITGQKKLEAMGAGVSFKTTSQKADKESLPIANINRHLLPLNLLDNFTKDFSPINALGKPITAGIEIASLVRQSEYKLDDGAWQSNLAKEVSKLLSANRSIKQNEVIKAIEDFWDNTSLAVQKGLEEMRRQSETHIELLTKDITRNYQESELEDYRWIVLKIADSLSQSNPPKYLKSVLLTLVIFLSLTLGTFAIYFLLSTPKQEFFIP